MIAHDMCKTVSKYIEKEERKNELIKIWTCLKAESYRQRMPKMKGKWLKKTRKNKTINFELQFCLKLSYKNLCHLSEIHTYIICCCMINLSL